MNEKGARAVTKQRFLHAASHELCVPPRALCHSVRAGYTLCLFVIPSDSAGARGQTCNPERSLHTQAPREHRKPTSSSSGSVSPFRLFPSTRSLPLPLSLSLSFSFSSYITVLRCCKMTRGSTFFCPPASFSDHFPPRLFINNAMSRSWF